MSLGLRVILILISILTFVYMVRKIRQSKLEIEYSLFWIGFSVLLLLLSIFPQIAYWCSDLLGVQSPVNFVFLVIIFILIMRNFVSTIQISQLDHRLKNLVQEVALSKKREEDAEK